MQTRCGGRFPDQRPHAVDGPTDLAHGLAEPALVGFLPLADLLAKSSRANTHETSGDVDHKSPALVVQNEGYKSSRRSVGGHNPSPC